jgi:hypothetical protein
MSVPVPKLSVPPPGVELAQVTTMIPVHATMGLAVLDEAVAPAFFNSLPAACATAPCGVRHGCATVAGCGGRVAVAPNAGRGCATVAG